MSSLGPEFSDELRNKALRVRALVLDVDGVLTDGRIVYDEFGDELKFFDVQDGAGLMLWHRAGLKSAIITARKSRMIKRRAKEMHVDFVAQKALVKLSAYEKFLKRFRISSEEVCAIGDDLMDIPILSRAGLAIAVPNAVEEVKSVCHHVTVRYGGKGAIREMIDFILKAKGLWVDVFKRYQV